MLLSRIYVYGAITIVVAVGLYVWHYEPLAELITVKEENLRLIKTLDNMEIDCNTTTFEKEWNATITSELHHLHKEDKNETIPITVGKHSITID